MKKEYTELFTAEGHLNEEGMALAVDALFLGKTGRLPAKVQDHMTDCAECRREIAALFDLVAENRDLYPRINHPLLDTDDEATYPGRAKLKPGGGFLQWIRRPAGIAASLLILFAAGGTWLLLRPADNTEDKIRAEIVGIMRPDSGDKLNEQIPEETIQFADNQGDRRLASVPGNPKLEAMYKLHLRGNDFQMKSPGKSTAVKHLEKITWEWETKRKISKLNLLIIDEQGVNRDQVHLDKKKYQFTVKLPDGLYYWVIVGDGELLSVGKFSVTND